MGLEDGEGNARTHFSLGSPELVGHSTAASLSLPYCHCAAIELSRDGGHDTTTRQVAGKMRLAKRNRSRTRGCEHGGEG